MSLIKIKACLEQKNLFMISIINITKQIEVLCQQPEVDLEHLLEDRQNNMDKIDKCNVLLKSTIELLPDEEKLTCTNVLEGTADKANSTDDVAVLIDLVSTYDSLLKQAIELDKSTAVAIKARYDDLRQKINTLRQKRNPNQMFAQKNQSMFTSKI